MKNKRYLSAPLLLLCTCLTSCNQVTSFVPYLNNVTDPDDFIEINEDGYYKPSSYLPVKYLNQNYQEETISNYKEAFENGDVEFCIPSTGELDLLVVPVQFVDYKITDSNVSIEKSLVNIQNAFFGDPSVNKWESVASYYNKSSYGKLKITGKVSDWFTYEDKTYSELTNSTVSSKVVGSIKDKAVQWYKETYDDFDRFDKDQDGNVDAIYLVYSCPPIIDNDRTSFFWAYVVYNKNPIAWSSYHLCYEENGYVDSHTYIHETAHIFGLQDYYDVDGILSPLYHLDMMDYNIGDHTGYSKMLLEWARPYVITGDCTLKIRPFSSSGDLILLKVDWNGSPMDEYLLLEYYAPQGLNYNDTKNSLGGVSLFNQTGLKVYHVDSRLGFVEKQNQRMVKGYVDDTKLSKNNYLVRVINSNSTRTYQNNLLYEFLPRIKNPSTINDILFRSGDKFSSLGYGDFVFNDGGNYGFDFEIIESTNTYCEIKFSKNF